MSLTLHESSVGRGAFEHRFLTGPVEADQELACELACQLGTVRELISRNLIRLQAGGLLDIDVRQIVVRDLKSRRRCWTPDRQVRE